MKRKITVFKIRIDSIQEHAIGFELFAGEKVKDTYVNVLTMGGCGKANRLMLTPKQFADFAQRLIAYVYFHAGEPINDKALKILWDLRLNIFDNENHQKSKSIFQSASERKRLVKLGLIKVKGEK